MNRNVDGYRQRELIINLFSNKVKQQSDEYNNLPKLPPLLYAIIVG